MPPVATTIELVKKRAKGKNVNALGKFSQASVDGSQVRLKTSSAGLSAVSAIHTNGTRHAAANTVSTV